MGPVVVGDALIVASGMMVSMNLNSCLPYVDCGRFPMRSLHALHTIYPILDSLTAVDYCYFLKQNYCLSVT